MTPITLDRALCAAILVALIVPSVAIADEDHSWHLLTQTYGGTVTLLKDLTKHECEFVRARALGLPATPEEEEEAKRNAALKAEREEQWAKHPLGPLGGPSSGHLITNNDVKSAECFR